jgi:hypothetical protein
MRSFTSSNFISRIMRWERTEAHMGNGIFFVGKPEGKRQLG